MASNPAHLCMFARHGLMCLEVIFSETMCNEVGESLDTVNSSVVDSGS